MNLDEPERIVAAAIRINGETYSMLPPAGYKEVKRLASACFPPITIFMPDDHYGFITSHGNFVNRKLAASIACLAEQIGSYQFNQIEELSPEDLW